MAVFLVWIADPHAVSTIVGSPGPWREVVEVAPGLLLVESDESLSRVYHEIKWLLPADEPLLTSPLEHRPKARGLAAGSVSWLRDRLPGS